MRRDMDLVRDILLAVEKADEQLDLLDLLTEDWVSKGRTSSEVAYHVALLIEKGYLDGTYVQSDDRSIRRASVWGLTWDGQDFLDTVRDDRLWAKVRKGVSDSVGSTTMEVVKSVAVKAASAMVSAQMGL